MDATRAEIAFFNNQPRDEKWSKVANFGEVKRLLNESGRRYTHRSNSNEFIYYGDNATVHIYPTTGKWRYVSHKYVNPNRCYSPWSMTLKAVRGNIQSMLSIINDQEFNDETDMNERGRNV